MKITFENNELKRKAKELGHRARLESAAAYGFLVLCRKYVRMESAKRHQSANKLGAKPSGFLEDAARTMINDGSSLYIACPGIVRAFKSLTIRPKAARSLTIPIASEAYAKRAGELVARGWKLFTNKLVKGVLFGVSPISGKAKPLYLLRGQVFQAKDRSLLPSDEALKNNAEQTVSKAIKELFNT